MSEAGRPARPGADRHKIDQALQHRLNSEWRVSAPPTPSSLRQRIAWPLRRFFGFLLGGQETFNSAAVQQLNQHAELIDNVFNRTEALFDDVEEIGTRKDDEVRRALEAYSARARRLEDALSAFRAEHAEIRTALGTLQQQASQLARQLARGAVAPAGGPAAAPAGDVVPLPPPAHALSYKYVGFEDAFRGSPDTIREGLRQYLPLFEGTSGVLDVGCGRGEFLALLRERGISARGIDLNDSMVDVCREKGLEASAADALGYLRQVPDGSLGGLFAAQVVEHLEPAYLTHLLEAAFDKLRPGAPIVLETINPACWFAFFESYIRDITHVRPLHPDTLTFLLVASGFQRAEVRYSAPYPEHHKLQPVAAPAGLADAVETLNANAEKINRLLFTYLDYAAVAYRP